LIDAVWAGDPPDAATSSLHVFISTFRKTLGGEQILRRGDGYRVDVTEDSFDILRFEALVDRGRRQLASDPAGVGASLVEALRLWHGSPYGELGSVPALVPEVMRLSELRLTAVEQRIEADLATGNHAIVVAEMETLVRDNPLRERFRAQQMLALYRSGSRSVATATRSGRCGPGARMSGCRRPPASCSTGRARPGR